MVNPRPHPALANGYIPPATTPCANLTRNPNGTTSNCTRACTLSCAGCHLVWYCSKRCQDEHWPRHIEDCRADLRTDSWLPGWVKEGRSWWVPPVVGSGTPNYLWGNMPAFDVVNVENNEGVGKKGWDLCFAASGDPRNVMCSVNGLPDTPDSTCNVFVNDMNHIVVARNITMLLLAAQLPPLDAAELILHVWYSARLSRYMVAAIKKYATEPIADVVAQIQDVPEDSMQAKTWSFGAVEVNVCLLKQQWTALLKILEAEHDLSKTEAERQKVVLDTDFEDMRDYDYCLWSGSRRVTSRRFSETGVIVPFGTCIALFECPNPLLSDGDTSAWLLERDASPLDGWAIQSVRTPSTLECAARNDLHGLLYFHVRAVIQKFADNIQRRFFKTRFTLYCLDAVKFAEHLRSQPGFDRIEVSNIIDSYYLGIRQTLATFAPLLKPQSVNSHAALITLFMNACGESLKCFGVEPDTAHTEKVMKHTGLDETDVMRAAAEPDRPESIRITRVHHLVRDFDRLFGLFSDSKNLSMEARNAGLRRRVPSTVIEAWPLKFRKEAGEEGAEEELSWLVGSGRSGGERYVEWIKEDNVVMSQGHIMGRLEEKAGIDPVV